MMKFLQKLGKSLMMPVAVLPICGILMGIGYLLCPAVMQGGDITGIVPTIGFVLTKAGGAIIDNMAWLFVIGVSVGMSDDQNGAVSLAGLVSWFVVITLLSPTVLQVLLPGMSETSSAYLAFTKIQNPFIAIICGVLAASCYNRLKDTKLPDYLAFFSGRRFVVIVTAVMSIALALVLAFAWPMVFTGLTKFGQAILNLGGIGAGIYAFFNRLLIPFGLHHALNNVFWFDTIGIGDLTNFWAGKTSADVGWDLGMYMSGFFPCMMFGIPGAALAMIKNAKNKKVAKGILLSTAICAFICGVTEPFEFLFMYAAFPLYVIYAFLYGVFTTVVYYVGFRAGFSFSAGATDLLFSSSLPAAQKIWLIIPLGIAAFVVFYLIFDFMIKKFNFITPGREDEADAEGEQAAIKVNLSDAEKAKNLIAAIGGSKNIVDVDCCATRLRLQLKDTGLVDTPACKKAGAIGVVISNKESCQVIIGVTVQQVCDAVKAELANGGSSADEGEVLHAPIKGKKITLQDVKDEAFASGVLGEGVAYIPDEGTVYAPCDATVVIIPDSKHSVSLCNDAGMEILIHVGIDTVKLNGQYFEPLVKEGDQVKTGTPLLKFDIEGIKSAGYDTTTPMVVCNSEDFENIIFLEGE